MPLTVATAWRAPVNSQSWASKRSTYFAGRGHPAGIDALSDVGPLVPGEFGLGAARPREPAGTTRRTAYDLPAIAPRRLNGLGMGGGGGDGDGVAAHHITRCKMVLVAGKIRGLDKPLHRLGETALEAAELPPCVPAPSRGGAAFAIVRPQPLDSELAGRRRASSSIYRAAAP